MNIILIGTSHKVAPLEIRENLSFSKNLLELSYKSLAEYNIISSAVILSTCNRVEIYVEAEDKILGRAYLKQFIEGFNKKKQQDLSGYLYSLENEPAIRHLFKVASGLDSQVLGENQILGQIRQAYIHSKAFWKNCSSLDRVFNKAIETGKKIRRDTKISEGNISVATLAIKLLEEKFGRFVNLSVLVIGTGEIGKFLLIYLKQKGVNTVIIANRTYNKALSLAGELNCKIARFDELAEELLNVDVVICSTSSPHLILREADLRKVMSGRKKPLFILDLAVPRDVEESAKCISGVILYNIDDLGYVIEENIKRRKEEAILAERIIDKEIKNFVKILWKKNVLLSAQGQAS